MSGESSFTWSFVGSHFDEVAVRHETSSRHLSPKAVDGWVDGQLTGLLTSSQSGIVADLGCGGGRASVAALRRGRRVLLVDASREMLRIASTRLAEFDKARWRIHHGDACEALEEADPEFDLVLMVGELLAYLPDPGRALRLARSRLHPSGTILGTYMRREVLVDRLKQDEIVADDGAALILRERRGSGLEPDLLAKAFSDSEMQRKLTDAGFRSYDLFSENASGRGGFVARPV